MFIDAVVWAMKHTDRDIQDVGLTILIDLLKNISGSRTAHDDVVFMGCRVSRMGPILVCVVSERCLPGGVRIGAQITPCGTCVRAKYYVASKARSRVPVWSI